MKPIIIFIDSENSDTLIIKKTDFENYIKEAYDQGREDESTIITKLRMTTYLSAPVEPNIPVITYQTICDNNDYKIVN